jgi:hypothetical protein
MGVHVHDHAAKGVVAVADDLAETETGGLNLDHAATLGQRA